jgi:hypothetical protein
MPTFDDNELGSSIRTKLNNALTKVDGIETGATADQTGAEIKALYELEPSAFTDAQFTKLTGIETGATADQTGAEIKALYEAEADTNAFTDADHSKLDGIEAGATADQTGAEIKALYEVEANAFTDTQFTKLAGIEAGATADQTDAEIKTAYENNADTNAFTDADKGRLDGLEPVVVNGDFKSGDTTGWIGYSPTIVDATVHGAPAGFPYSNIAVIPTGTSNRDLLNELFRVSPGDVLRVEGYVSSSVDANSKINLGFRFSNKDGAPHVWQALDFIHRVFGPISGWQKIAGYVTVPDTVGGLTTSFARGWVILSQDVTPAGEYYFTGMRVRRVETDEGRIVATRYPLDLTGVTDDTAIIQTILDDAAASDVPAFFPAPHIYKWTSALDATGVLMEFEHGATVDAPNASLTVNGGTVEGRFASLDINKPKNVGPDNVSSRVNDGKLTNLILNGDNTDFNEWNSIGLGVIADVDGLAANRIGKATSFKTYMNYGAKGTTKGDTEGTAVLYQGRMTLYDVLGAGTSGTSELTPIAVGLVCKNDGATDYEQNGGNYYNDIVMHGPAGTDSAKRENFLAGMSLYTSKWTPGTTIDSTHEGAYGMTVFTDHQAGGFGGGGGTGLSSYSLTAGISIQGWAGAYGATINGGHDASATVGYEVGLQIGGSRGSVWTTPTDVGSKMNYGITVEDYGADFSSYGIYVKESHFSTGVFGIYSENRVHIESASNSPKLEIANYGSSLGQGIRFDPATDVCKPAQFRNTSGTEVGSITQTASATAYNISSDETLKDFHGELDGQRALDIIKADPTREFSWKSTGESAVGWGAQTSYSVSSDLATPGGWVNKETGDPCSESDEGSEYIPWGLDQSKRTPYLWAAVSELSNQIDALKAEIKSLKEDKCNCCKSDT